MNSSRVTRTDHDKRRQASAGFTLIELLIVVAIIGIIAAVAVPQLTNALDRGRQKSTMANIKQLGSALEHYSIDNNGYPVATSIAALAQILEPDYMPKAPRTDGWKHQLSVSSSATTYTICSNGKDGSGNCETEALGAQTSFSSSITYVNNAFTTWPEGLQTQDQ